MGDDVAMCCAELQTRLEHDDPVTGVWFVPAGGDAEWRIWCDASSIATGVVAELNGKIIEDASWLRPVEDRKHINVAELDAVIKGLTLATEWHARRACVVTDSKTVYGWLQWIVNNLERVKVNGLYTVVVRCRLDIISSILAPGDLSLRVEWISSQQNKANCLTRIPDVFVQCWKS